MSLPISKDVLLPHGLHLFPVQGTFRHEFLTQLYAFIEALPGVTPADMSTQVWKGWWLSGSTFMCEEAGFFSLVAIKDTELILRFCTTTFEEHEARIIQWVLAHCVCTIYDFDWGTELTTSDELARWMSMHYVSNTGQQQRAIATLTEEVTNAFCEAIQYNSHEEFILFLTTPQHGQRRLVIPEPSIVLHENDRLPQLSRTESLTLRLLELCSRVVSSVLFTPDRVLHIVFDRAIHLDICAEAPGEYQYAWTLESPVPHQPHEWVERVWVRRGGDIVVVDAPLTNEAQHVE
ncbi:hypothetical protein [Leptolyngbya sp. FACHB-8]|uniref:hypothetical protein n=1 Tax=unclassified Leptolyngbya TaxID=2650499 RepID=UPI00168998AF|nr:hypothetical protein [Leptolyngbya sp. FACHB-8]MBD1914105.1 hypothetical protein [Leptolyngbya sp. FACHB-8]